MVGGDQLVGELRAFRGLCTNNLELSQGKRQEDTISTCWT